MQLCRQWRCSLFVRTTSGFWVWRTEKSEGVNGYEAKVKPVLFCSSDRSCSKLKSGCAFSVFPDYFRSQNFYWDIHCVASRIGLEWGTSRLVGGMEPLCRNVTRGIREGRRGTEDSAELPAVLLSKGWHFTHTWTLPLFQWVKVEEPVDNNSIARTSSHEWHHEFLNWTLPCTWITAA